MQLVTNDMPKHDVLLMPAKEVNFPLDTQTKKFIQELKDFLTTLESHNGKPAGLAAPQVGVGLRIILIQITPIAKKFRKDVFDMLPPTILINPTYEPIEEQGKSKDWEACYSVPNKMGEVDRYFSIQYNAYNENGKKVSGVAKGFLARLIQHEVGHLNGELFLDQLSPKGHFGTFDEMLPLRQQELDQMNLTDS